MCDTDRSTILASVQYSFMPSLPPTLTMPGFRWSAKLDIALCLEVFKTRPQKTADWEKVATSLCAETAEQAPAALPKARGAATFILPLCSLHSSGSDTQQPAVVP